MDNISLESTFHWLSRDTVKFEVDAGLCEKFAKNVTVDTCKIDIPLHAAEVRGDIIRLMVMIESLLVARLFGVVWAI